MLSSTRPAVSAVVCPAACVVVVAPLATTSPLYVRIQHLNLVDNAGVATSAVDIDRPLFQPSPPVVEFAGFSEFASVDASVSFRNMDKVLVRHQYRSICAITQQTTRCWLPSACASPSPQPCVHQVARRIKLEPIDSPFFKLSVPMNRRGQPTTDSRVAPGMEVFYTVTFLPRERQRDYNYDLVCVTEREKFIVPVRAKGVRASLVVPDSVFFGSAPVKTATSKTFVVRARARLCGHGACEVSLLDLLRCPRGAAADGCFVNLFVSFHVFMLAPSLVHCNASRSGTCQTSVQSTACR